MKMHRKNVRPWRPNRCRCMSAASLCLLALAACFSLGTFRTLINSRAHSSDLRVIVCDGGNCQVSWSETVQAGNAKEAASASFVPTSGRGLLESDSVPPEPSTGVPIVGVSDVRQIRQAVLDGAPHIFVQSHIDLRLKHTDATFTLGPLTNDTKSITGDCQQKEAASLFAELNITTPVDLQPGQCVLAIDSGLLNFERHAMVLENLLLLLVPRDHEGNFPLPALRVFDSQLLVSALTVHGGHVEACASLGCAIYSSLSSIAIESSLFQETDYMGPDIRLDPGSVMSVSQSSFLGISQDKGFTKSPQEAAESSFIVIHARRCATIVGHETTDTNEVHLRVTNTEFEGLSGVTTFNEETSTHRAHVYTDEPKNLAMCEVTLVNGECGADELVCEPASPQSLGEIPSTLQYLERSAKWIQNTLLERENGFLEGFPQWNRSQQAQAPAPAPEEAPDPEEERADATPSAAENAMFPVAQYPANAPDQLEAFAAAPEAATQTDDKERTGSKLSYTKVALLTVAAVAAIVLCVVGLNYLLAARCNLAREAPEASRSCSYTQQGWDILRGLPEAASSSCSGAVEIPTRLITTQETSVSSRESLSPESAAQPAQMEEPKPADAPPSASSANDHDLPDTTTQHPTGYTFQPFSDHLATVLERWKRKIKRNMSITDPSWPADKPITIAKLPDEPPSHDVEEHAEQLKVALELHYQCDMIVSGFTRNCDLALYPNRLIKAYAMARHAPPEEALRHLMPEILCESDNRESVTLIGSHKAPPLVVLADDESLMMLAPNLKWRKWVILEMAVHVGSQLVELHDHGYVHRQVTCWSVRLVQYPDGSVRWRVYNWGLLRREGLSGPMSRPDASLPPEHHKAYLQGLRDYVAHCSEDVHGHACLILECLAGCPVRKWGLRKMTNEEVMRAAASDGHLPHENLNQDVRRKLGPLEPLLLECLDKTPANRPTMRQFMQRLRSIMDAMRSSPQVQQDLEDNAPYVEDPLSSGSAIAPHAASLASGSSPTQASDGYTSHAPTSAACSPPASMTDVLHNHLTQSLSYACNGPRASGSAHPQSVGGNNSMPTGSVPYSGGENVCSQASTSTAARSSTGPQSLLAPLLGVCSASGGQRAATAQGETATLAPARSFLARPGHNQAALVDEDVRTSSWMGLGMPPKTAKGAKAWLTDVLSMAVNCPYYVSDTGSSLEPRSVSSHRAQGYPQLSSADGSSGLLASVPENMDSIEESSPQNHRRRLLSPPPSALGGSSNPQSTPPAPSHAAATTASAHASEPPQASTSRALERSERQLEQRVYADALKRGVDPPCTASRRMNAAYMKNQAQKELQNQAQQSTVRPARAGRLPAMRAVQEEGSARTHTTHTTERHRQDSDLLSNTEEDDIPLVVQHMSPTGRKSRWLKSSNY